MRVGSDWQGVRRRNVCFTSLGSVGTPAYDSQFQGLPFLTSDFIWGTGSKQSIVQLQKWKHVVGEKILEHYPVVKGDSVKKNLEKLLQIAENMGKSSFESCTPSEWVEKPTVQKELKRIGWKAGHLARAAKDNI